MFATQQFPTAFTTTCDPMSRVPTGSWSLNPVFQMNPFLQAMSQPQSWNSMYNNTFTQQNPFNPQFTSGLSAPNVYQPLGQFHQAPQLTNQELVQYLADDRRRDFVNDNVVLALLNSLKHNRRSDQIVRDLLSGRLVQDVDIVRGILADRLKDVQVSEVAEKVICDRIQNRQTDTVLEQLVLKVRRPESVWKQYENKATEQAISNAANMILAQDQQMLNPQFTKPLGFGTSNIQSSLNPQCYGYASQSGFNPQMGSCVPNMMNPQYGVQPMQNPTAQPNVQPNWMNMNPSMCSTGMCPTGMGPTGMGSTGMGPTGMGSTGMGPTVMGQHGGMGQPGMQSSLMAPTFR